MATGRSNRHAPPPPLPFDSSLNAPIRVYPPEPTRSAAGSSAASLLQVLQSVNKNVVVVGIISTSTASPEQAYTFANRLIGRCVFLPHEMMVATIVKGAPLYASIHLYFNEKKNCVYLLGIARPENQCFSGGGNPSRRYATADFVNSTPTEQLQKEMAGFEHERLKMEVLLYSSCNLVFEVHESARITTNLLKRVRSIASEKQQLQAFVAATTKSSKREKAGSSGAGNAFVPGRCVPLALFVVPAPDEVLHAKLKQSSSSKSSRSATVTYCRSLETKLVTLLRSLRGGLVGSVRMRDALTASNLSKERRVFNVDATHCVVIVSKKTVTSEGRLEARLEDVLASITIDDQPLTDDLDFDTILQPLEEDDTGFSRATHYLQRYLDFLFSSLSSSSGNSNSNSKDTTLRADLLTLSQWLKAFNSLVKSMHRLEIKRKQDTAAAASAKANATTIDQPIHHQQLYQYEPMLDR